MNKKQYNLLVRFYYQSKRKLKRLIIEGKNLRKQKILHKRLLRLHERLIGMQRILKGSIASAALLGSMTLLPTNDVQAQISFGTIQNSPFSLTTVGTYAVTSLVDLDNDGDNDLMTGDFSGNFSYFQNTGTNLAPNFAAAQTNPFSLTDIGTAASPTFADLDNDGDLDMISGINTGNFIYFQNTGTASAPSFAASQTNPFSLTDIGTFSRLTIIDLDNDGDMDLMAGEITGNFHYFENIGTASAPSFAAVQSNPFSLAAVATYAAPTFADLDMDGDLDMVSGSSNGAINYFLNTGTVSAPSFATAQINPFSLTYPGTRSTPDFADIDNDGDMDLFLGISNGSIKYFENTSPVPPAPEINITGNSVNIVDGDVTASATDHTDFGTQDICSGNIIRTFTIQNIGTAPLTFSDPVLSGTDAAEFSISVLPTSPVGQSTSTTFQVTFDPSSAGVKNATVTVNNNDGSEGTYDFAIKGTGSGGSPSITSTTPNGICGTGTVDLAATASSGTLNWYDAPSGGTLLGSGTSFTTPSISTSTSYYVEAVVGTCISARTAVLASTGACTQLRTPYRNRTLVNLNDYMACDAVAGATQYRFEITDGTNTYTYVSATFGIRLNLVSGIKYGTTYSIKAAAQVGGTWLGYGTSYNVTTPLTIVQPWYCGVTNTNMTDYMACYPVEGATQYQFEITEGSNVFTYTSNSTGFRFSNFTGLKYNTTYSVRVAAKVGGTFSAYGTACNITTPLTKMQSFYCGITVSPMSQYLACYTVNGATQYRFKLFDGTNTLYFTSSSIGLRLSLVPGIQTNTTYDVSVSSYDGSSWSAYGSSCSITSAATMSAMQQDGEIVIEATENVLQDISIEAYPNPNAGNFVVTSTHDGALMLTNELGQVLQTINLNDANKRQITIEGMANGVYFLTGIIQNELITKKIIVQ